MHLDFLGKTTSAGTGLRYCCHSIKVALERERAHGPSLHISGHSDWLPRNQSLGPKNDSQNETNAEDRSCVMCGVYGKCLYAPFETCSTRLNHVHIRVTTTVHNIRKPVEMGRFYGLLNNNNQHTFDQELVPIRRVFRQCEAVTLSSRSQNDGSTVGVSAGPVAFEVLGVTSWQNRGLLQCNGTRGCSAKIVGLWEMGVKHNYLGEL